MASTVRLLLGIILVIVGVFTLLLIFGIVFIIVGVFLLASGYDARHKARLNQTRQQQEALLTRMDAQQAYLETRGSARPLSFDNPSGPPPPTTARTAELLPTAQAAVRHCPSCSADNAREATFCGDCGKPLLPPP